jgi:hypothetical protein
MKHMKRTNQSLYSLVMLLIIALAVNLAHAQGMQEWEEQGTVMVGRISHVEGQLSRYDADTGDWTATSREAPIGVDDLLRTEAGSRAEFIMPNNTWARIDSLTELELVALDPGLTHADIPGGNARFYNKSTQSDIKASTPFGTVTAPPGAVFDVYVDKYGVDVIAIEKNVRFIHNASQQKHEVRSNSAGIYADIQTITASSGDVDPSWTAWNHDMDALWAGRMASRGDSNAYLPPQLHSEAYALDRHGIWERVYYKGTYYRFWRPVQVGVGWSPFTWGAWIVWHGDHVWVPHEPFGYVTHHYGNWIFTDGYWYWAPPVTRVMVHAHAPLLRIGFGWYPGRVSWIHFGARVGWIPLAPYEPYYTHCYWGRRSIVVAKGSRFHHHPHSFAHHLHAVVIHRNHLYRSKNYRHARIRGISHGTIRTRYRSAPLLNRKVIKDRGSLENKHRFKPPHRRYQRYHAAHNSHRERERIHTGPSKSSHKLRPTGHHRVRPSKKRKPSERMKPARSEKPLRRQGMRKGEKRPHRQYHEGFKNLKPNRKIERNLPTDRRKTHFAAKRKERSTHRKNPGYQKHGARTVKGRRNLDKQRPKVSDRPTASRSMDNRHTHRQETHRMQKRAPAKRPPIKKGPERPSQWKPLQKQDLIRALKDASNRHRSQHGRHYQWK